MTRSLPSDWKYRRKEVLQKHGYECVNCGREGRQNGSQLEIHHIVPREVGGTHKLSNLIPLCTPCHFAVHHANIQAPTAGPTIDYDKLARGLHTPPEYRSEEQKEYLTQVGKKLNEYAGPKDYQYYPSAYVGQDVSPQLTSETPRSTEKAPSDLWDHLQGKWATKH